MHMGDERILAPLAAFIPDLLGLYGEELMHVPQPYQSDPGDPKDEDYIKQTMSKHEQVHSCIKMLKLQTNKKTFYLLISLKVRHENQPKTFTF